MYNSSSGCCFWVSDIFNQQVNEFEIFNIDSRNISDFTVNPGQELFYWIKFEVEQSIIDSLNYCASEKSEILAISSENWLLTSFALTTDQRSKRQLWKLLTVANLYHKPSWWNQITSIKVLSDASPQERHTSFSLRSVSKLCALSFP